MSISRQYLLYLLAFTVVGCTSDASEEAGSSTAPADPGAGVQEAAPVIPDSAVRHVVIFKYRPEATDAQIAEVTTAFRDLPNQIPGILSFEHGVNNSPEGLNQGFTHAYTLTFQNAAARDAYLPHPAHAAFGDLLNRLGVVEEVFVVDYVPGP